MEILNFLTLALQYSGLDVKKLDFWSVLVKNWDHIQIKVNLTNEFVTFSECQKFCKEEIGGRLPFAEDHSLIVASFAKVNWFQGHKDSHFCLDKLLGSFWSTRGCSHRYKWAPISCKDKTAISWLFTCSQASIKRPRTRNDLVLRNRSGTASCRSAEACL